MSSKRNAHEATDPFDLTEKALRLFESGEVTMGQAAQLANVPLVDFIDLLGKAGIAAVDYPPEELERELEVIRKSRRE